MPSPPPNPTLESLRDAPEFAQRFIGELSSDGSAITGKWEINEDGDTWRHDFDLVYRRGRSPKR